uniref:PPM-type phosphatase domain-containing protein n=1 Tax=Noctiluca scintillans TaxID=2966 RepID=A0A7S0ZV87_NOCSC
MEPVSSDMDHASVQKDTNIKLQDSHEGLRSLQKPTTHPKILSPSSSSATYFQDSSFSANTETSTSETRHLLEFVSVEEYSEGGKTLQVFSLEKVHEMLERRFKEGVRLDENSMREMMVVRPRLDDKFRPLHVVQETQAENVPHSFGPVSLATAGGAKADRINGGEYGEDIVGCAVLVLPTDLVRQGFSVDWIFEADGHGGNGAQSAALSKRLFHAAWSHLAPEICRLTEAGDMQRAMQVMQQQGYNMVVSMVNEAVLREKWSGTTVTQMLTVTLRSGRRIAYSSNMGDSPAAVIVLSGGRAKQAGRPKVFVTSCAHNWEDECEMRRYVEHLAGLRMALIDKGQPYDHIQPAKVCYCSFNCVDGSALDDVHGNQPHFDDASREWRRGACEPILMWKYEELKDTEHRVVGWDLKLDEVAEEHVWRAARKRYGDEVIGGIHAPVAKEVLVCGVGATPFRPLFPSLNWGSTPLVACNRRGCQATRGIGDIDSKAIFHTSDEATWMAFEILPDETVVQLVMSDGVGEVVALQALGEHLADLVKKWRSGGDARVLAREIMRLVSCKAPFKPNWQGRLSPTHDDCSVALAFRTAAKMPRSSNFAGLDSLASCLPCSVPVERV